MKKSYATLLLLLASCIWGFAFVAQRAGMDYVGAFTFNSARFLLGALSLLPAIYFFERRFAAGKDALPGETEKDHPWRMRQTWKAGLWVGLVLFMAASLQQIGVDITRSAGKAGFITGLYIVITPLLGRALGKRIGLPVWLGALIACVGLYLMSVQTTLSAVGMGDLALIAGAFFWAVHILSIDHFAGAVYPMRFAAIQFVVCALLSMAAAFLFEEVRWETLQAGRAPILYNGLLSVGVAYTLQVIGQRKVESAKAALIFSTEALFAALGAGILLQEILTPRAYMGGALIFAGVLVSQWKGKPAKAGGTA